MLSGLFGRKCPGSTATIEVASPLGAARTGLAGTPMPPHDVLCRQFRAFLVRAPPPPRIASTAACAVPPSAQRVCAVACDAS